MSEQHAPSSNGRRVRAHRRQEERRSQILAAARELIEREGYARMTMSAVAKAAGVSRPTLFNYVPSRAALRDALEAQGVVIPAEKTEGTRQGILEAALALFAERGFASTTVADIAERAGVSKAAIYWHFRDKEALLEAAFVTVVPAARIHLALRDLAGLEPEVVLERVAEEYLAGFRRLLRHFRIVLSGLETVPRFRAFMNRYVALELVALLAHYLDREVRAGRLASADPCLAAQTFYSALFGFVIMRDVMQRDDLRHLHDQGLARTVAHTFLEGLRPRGELRRDHATPDV